MYLCRYGKQPLSEVLELSAHDARSFAEALERCIKAESGSVAALTNKEDY